MGRDVPGNLALARELKERFSKIPGAVDVTLREVLDQPGYAIRIDRARAGSFGINAQDAASALLAALGSGGSVAPNFWSDPATGAAYDVQIIAPPANLYDFSFLAPCPSSGLIVHGEKDAVVPPKDRAVPSALTTVVVPSKPVNV